MVGNLLRICDGVYVVNGEAGASVIFHDDMELYRFMDIFYINCNADELAPFQVQELCRVRATNASSFSGANAKVREIFKSLVTNALPSSLLEIGAGTNPIFSAEEISAMRINYVKSDADPSNAEEINVFSGEENVLNYPDDCFDMVVAVFVLHFKFYAEQISEIRRCLKPTGAFVANVYRRTGRSRWELRQDFEQQGFSLLVLNDPNNLCKDHEYWIVCKDKYQMERIQNMLVAIIGNQ